MEIALIGYGKMGKEIAAMAAHRGHLITAKIDEYNKDQLLTLTESAEVAIEFSQPEAAFENLKSCFDLGVPVISGTTGWIERKPELEAYCLSVNGTFFYSSNFSLGVQLFFRLNQRLSKMMEGYPDYGVHITETHHTEKKDAPSGTAISLADDIISSLTRKESWKLAPTNVDSELEITSFREAQVSGTHLVTYHSEIDDIEIKHTAHSRRGFALGAVMVAEWIKDKKGILTMDDFLNSSR